MTTPTLSLRIVVATTLLCGLASSLANHPFAATVIDYQPGYAATLTNPYAAVGLPGSIVGADSGFDGIYSPFNPHYEAHHLTQIGEGGSLTLRLNSSVNTSSNSLDLGIFTNVGLIDADWPNGLSAGSFGVDSVTLEVSADGVSWRSIGSINCDFPASAFTNATSPYQADTTGLTPSDFSKPHSLTLANLNGKTHAQILTMLATSAGGTWVNLSPSGLPNVAYLRFSLPDDGNASTTKTFELAGVSINGNSIGPPPIALSLIENFATNPIGTRATSSPGHATYLNQSLRVGFDLTTAPARTSWPLGQTLTDSHSFGFSADFRVNSLNFDTSSFGQISFGFVNSITTGNLRTTSPSNSWDLVTVDYFPNEDLATLTPTVIGSRRAGQNNAFDNLGFPSGSTSLINEFDEIGQLPINTPLTLSLNYDAPTRTLTLRLHDRIINDLGANPDNDLSTIQYTVPANLTFNVDTFALLCWQEASGGNGTLTFTNLEISTPSPPPNYYSWADSQISDPILRATHLDANNDRLENLLHYALNGAPPSTVMTSNSYGLQWFELPQLTDVSVVAELSSDLVHWSPTPDFILNAAPSIELHQATVGIGSEKKFLRLKASRP